MNQPQKLAKLLARKRGATAFEIMLAVGTTCPHKRMSDLKARGWHITRKNVPGTNYGRYFGVAPGKKL
jgi:hypothetical protein